MSRRAPACLLALAVLCCRAPLAAQEPFSPKNLQILPRDIDRQALMESMQGFAAALDVRCDHCHAQDAQGGPRLDFAADTKETKKVTRAMMRMAQTINDTLLPRTGRTNLLSVECATCHHGLARPQALQAALRTAYQQGGLDSAVAAYQELRTRYYGRAAYDFGEPSLVTVGRDFLASKDVDAAARFLQMNLEYFPRSADTYVQLSEVSRARGDRDAARQYLQQALGIEPDNRGIRRRLDAVDHAE